MSSEPAQASGNKWAVVVLTCFLCPVLVAVVTKLLIEPGNNPSPATQLPQDKRPSEKPLQSTAVSVDEAREMGGKGCTVEMQVRSARRAKEKPIAFLNSERSFQSPKNFSVMIGEKALQTLKTKGLSHESYDVGKTIRVTGIVKSYRGSPEIVVDSADQIEMVSPR